MSDARRLEDAEQRIADLVEANEDLSRELARVRQELSEREDRLRFAEARLEKLTTSEGIQKAEVAHRDRRLAALQDQLTAKDKRIEQLTNDLAASRAQLDDFRRATNAELEALQALLAGTGDK